MENVLKLTDEELYDKGFIFRGFEDKYRFYQYRFSQYVKVFILDGKYVYYKCGCGYLPFESIEELEKYIKEKSAGKPKEEKELEQNELVLGEKELLSLGAAFSYYESEDKIIAKYTINDYWIERNNLTGVMSRSYLGDRIIFKDRKDFFGYLEIDDPSISSVKPEKKEIGDTPVINIKELRMELQKEIAGLISNFEHQTGAYVEGINVLKQDPVTGESILVVTVKAFI